MSLKGSQHLRLSLKEIKLATNNFSEQIGNGGYGVVFKGELFISGRSTTVAVKRLNEKSDQGLKEFWTEIQLLSGQNHKNVVSLLGYCDEGKEKSLIYEYAANGSLDVCLKKNDASLTWRKRLEICLDAARGLNHLHSNSRNKQTIIHRDIKSANILLDQKWVGKISDLGLSKLNNESSEGSTIVSNACGTIGYCDPEYCNGILKKECDVYSFGIVLFEILCGRRCLLQHVKDGFMLFGTLVQKYYTENKMKEIIDPCLRGQMSSYSISRYSELAYKCLLKDERQRPSMDRVVKELKELLLIQAIDAESQKSNSCSSDPISKLRYGKVRRIFGRFDLNRDGVLNKEELANFFQVLGQPLFLSDTDGIRRKINHMNFLKTKQSFKHKYFGPGLFLIAKQDFKQKYFGPDALRKYQGILQDLTLRIGDQFCDNQIVRPPPLSEREIRKVIDTVLSLFGESTNGEIGLTCDGMLRFYDQGVDVLHDHFEFLRLDHKFIDDNEDSFRTTERYEKVKRIFQRFDMNKDGYLDITELHSLLSINSHNQNQGLLFFRVLHIFKLYSWFIEGDKGFNCDGLFKFYGFGIDSLEDDFEKLKLTLNLLDEKELALRYEKVRRIFQRFDINEDGVLNKEELTQLIRTTSEVKNDENSNSFIVDHTLSKFREYTCNGWVLTCDGLLHGYEYSYDTLDDDIKKLRLDQKPLDEREDNLRKMERAKKVRIMFERFDLNGDGGLDRLELGNLLEKKNPPTEAREEVRSDVDKVFRWYAKYVDGDKGLSCDGLLRTYDHGIDSLDVDFEMLGLELRISTETENASRKRDRSDKVRQIFKRFDYNEDGGLDRNEVTSYLDAVKIKDQLSGKRMNSNVNNMFKILGKFVDGVTAGPDFGVCRVHNRTGPQNFEGLRCYNAKAKLIHSIMSFYHLRMKLKIELEDRLRKMIYLSNSHFSP